LHLALVALGVGPGDEVIVPSLSFIATANAVRYVGAQVVFADVDEATQNLSVGTIGAVVTRATRAIILVHQGGVPADIGAVRAFAERAGIAVVEDAACALGSTYRGELIGAHSDFVAFSFHARKLLTTGEGGMLMTGRDDVAARLRRLREHGMSVSAADRHASTAPIIEAYPHLGFNYRLTDIQAAVGLVQLTRLERLLARRRTLARRYQAELADISGLGIVADPPYGETNFQSFWIALPDAFPMSRNQLLHQLAGHGIAARRGFMAAHLEPAYADVRTGDLTVTERLTRQSLILPLFHELTDAEQEQVITVVRAAAGVAT
jgi:perosamine synthetase